jgi:F-type H+-transporting ATPase subunit a
MAAIDPIHQFQIEKIVQGPVVHLGKTAIDLSITNVTLSMLIAAGLVILLFAVLSINPKVVPGRLQVVGEGLFGLIDDLAASMMGEESVKFFPFVFSLFSFILMMNMLGLFIFFHTATSQLAVTATLAALTILTVIIVGFIRNGLGFFKLFVPSGVPIFILPFLVIIEVISFLMRPMTLALRLFGNMLGGHIVMNIFASFVVGLGGFALAAHAGWLGWLGLPAAGVTFVAVIAMTTLEFIVAFLQAFVFAALTCVYLNDVVNLHSHSH